jgi:hypothetical protein
VLIETCDKAIGKENDHLKREAKKLEVEVNKLKKRIKVQPPQDNHINVVKKVEKGRITPKVASQQSRKQVQHEKDEKRLNMQEVSS